MDEQRLPFPIHGTRFTGDGDPQRGVGEAARLLYFVNLIAQTAGVPVYRLSRQTPYGQVTASVHGPLAFKAVHSVAEPEEPAPEEEVAGITRLVWLPEGFVITPRTAGAPDGFGMPPTPDGKGTPGGPLREVIINRLENNSYPDAIHKALGDASEEVAGRPLRVCAAGLMCMDWEIDKPDDKVRGGGFSVGMNIAGKWVQQFSDRFDTNFNEIDVSEWYCHRPMVDPGQEDKFLKRMRDRVNEMRAAVGRAPVGRPLRGSDGMLSESAAYAAHYSGIMAHDCDLFRDGHHKFYDRSQLRCGSVGAWRVGENLHASSAVVVDNDAVDDAMAAWKASAGHYRNIIYDWGEDGGEGYGELYPSVDSAARALNGDVIKGGIGPPYLITTPIDDYDPPASGPMFVQVFSGRPKFVGSGAHDGRQPVRIGIEPQFAGASFFSPFQDTSGGGPFDRPLPVAGQYTSSNERRYMAQSVCCHGHEIPVVAPDPDDDDPPAPQTAAVLSAAAATVAGVQVLRIITLDRPHEVISKHRPAALVVREGLLHDFWSTQKVVGRFEFPLDTGSMSTIKTSVSGDKAVFCYSITEPCLTRTHWRPPFGTPRPDMRKALIQTTVLTEAHDHDKDPFVWGCTLRFVEWTAGSGFSVLLDSSLEITPELSFSDWPERGVNFYHSTYTQTCAGEYKLFADYVGEDVVYATARVDCSLKHRNGCQDSEIGPIGRPMYERKMHGEIVFPDSTRLIYSDTTAFISGSDAALSLLPIDDNGASGMFRDILHLDILRPNDAVYIQHEIGGTVEVRSSSGGANYHDFFPTSKCSIVSCGVKVKEMADVMQSTMFDGPYRELAQEVGTLGESVGSKFARACIGFLQYAGYREPGTGRERATFTPSSSYLPQLPAAPFKAMLFDDSPIPGLMGRGNESPITLPQIVGPRFYRGRYLNQPLAHLVRYGGHSIAAGKVNNPFGFIGGGWVGDDGYFWQSTLNLKAITGLPDLKDNIMPIGVL